MRYGGTPNNLPPQYQYGQVQGHAGGLPPPSMGGHNPGFINPSPMGNGAFATNGHALSIGGNYGGSGLGMPGGTGLASQAAQISFANASFQQHGQNGMGEGGARNRGKDSRIRDVWKSNLQEEMAILRQLVDKYQYIALVRYERGG
jgi:CCR4-NOT transcription complex subunit 7/8